MWPMTVVVYNIVPVKFANQILTTKWSTKYVWQPSVINVWRKKAYVLTTRNNSFKNEICSCLFLIKLYFKKKTFRY